MTCAFMWVSNHRLQAGLLSNRFFGFFPSCCCSSFLRSFSFARGFLGVAQAFPSRVRRLRLFEKVPSGLYPHPHPTPCTLSFLAFFVFVGFPSGLFGRRLCSFSQRAPCPHTPAPLAPFLSILAFFGCLALSFSLLGCYPGSFR